MRWPYSTIESPPVAAIYKARHEDFVVEEREAYPPSGAGTHVHFTIEKRGLTTHQAIAICARALGRAPRDFGAAGLKDARGVTRQRLSIEHERRERVLAIEARGLRVLAAELHGNKLKIGHLRGNRFELRLRGEAARRVEDVRAVIAVLALRGVPNYFGEQRFGARGDTWEIGRALLAGDHDGAARLIGGDPRPIDRGAMLEGRTLFAKGEFDAAARAYPGSMRDPIRLARAMARKRGDARSALHAVDRGLLRFFVSAWQAWLFNEVVAARIGELGRLIDGDLAWKHENGAVFRVADPSVEQPRADALEISPSGPLFGARMTEPEGAARSVELAVLERAGVDRASFDRKQPWQPAGGRRPLRFPLVDPGVETGTDDLGEFVELRFDLDPGSYATSVLREIVKDARAIEAEAEALDA